MILNSKTVLFFALFLPPFVDTTSHHAVGASLQTQLLILGMTVPTDSHSVRLIVAYLGGTLVQTASKKRVLREGFAWIGGTLVSDCNRSKSASTRPLILCCKSGKPRSQISAAAFGSGPIKWARRDGGEFKLQIQDVVSVILP